MTAPGDASGESAHDDDGAHSPPPGQQPPWEPPWDSPAPPPAGDYPSAPYPPSGYPPGHPAGYPPTGMPPGYQTPPGHGGAPHPPGPPQFGGPPAGYGPPPFYPGEYPGGYYPPPDYQGYGPQGAYGLQPGMSGLAIGSLISSFTGLFCCIGGIVAIVLGAIALGQIKRTHQDGYALAVAGIVIGVATMIVNLVVAIFALQH